MAAGGAARRKIRCGEIGHKMICGGWFRARAVEIGAMPFRRNRNSESRKNEMRGIHNKRRNLAIAMIVILSLIHMYRVDIMSTAVKFRSGISCIERQYTISE